MPKKKDAGLTGRREFLRLASLGTVVGGAGLVLRDGAAEAKTATIAKGSTGYRETPHVKAFYDTARF